MTPSNWAAQTYDAERLRGIKYEQGAWHLLCLGPGPRHAIVALLDPRGFREAFFVDGEKHKFTTLVCMVNGDGAIMASGGHGVLRYPDGSVLAVVQPRPGIRLNPGGAKDVQFLDGRPALSLEPDLTVEFHGGTRNEDEHVLPGILRECREEAGLAPGTKVRITRSLVPVDLAVAEMPLAISISVVDLPENTSFEGHVADDGGLRTIRLSSIELWLNKARGVFRAASAVACLDFLRDVEDATRAAQMHQLRTITVEEAVLK